VLSCKILNLKGLYRKQNTLNFVLKKCPLFYKGANISSKAVSRVLFRLAATSIINLFCTLLHNLNDLPILTFLAKRERAAPLSGPIWSFNS
jgi:hypothetical protein